MKSVDEIIAIVAHRIGDIYNNQPAYRPSGRCVDELLIVYHELWAEIIDRQEELTTEYRKGLREAGCGTARFPTHYSLKNPQATEQEITDFVVNQWRKISERLGIPIPK